MEKNKIGFTIFKTLLALPFYLIYRPKKINKNLIPKNGPIILCGNHTHAFDSPLVILCSKRMIHFMAKDEYHKGKASWWFKIMGTIPVDRTKKDDKAYNSAIEVLNNNNALALFPEGTRNKTDKVLLPLKFGVVSLAKKTNATIVPFIITGQYKFLSKDLKIKFLEPFKIGKMDLEEANKKLTNILEKNLKEAFKNGEKRHIYSENKRK